MDEKTYFATVAEHAGLSKEEAADLTRATLKALAGQISGGEIQKLAATLPDWLEPHFPRHNGQAHPKQLAETVREVSRTTGLTEEETTRGMGAVLTVLRQAIDPTHLDHALALLPKEYRRLEAG